MREIKFRCWDTGINFMYYDTDCYNIYNENDNGLHSGYEDKYGTWHQNKLMQYTGLKDKNGVEIYEGDILAGCNGSINGTGWNWGNYSISFKDGKFDVPLWGTFEHYDSTHWFEVIGNIYETPELLHVKAKDA